MVGMPTRKANSVAAARLVVPASRATKMVAALREVPGNTPATTWAMPTSTAVVHEIAARSPSRAARLAARCSASTIQNAPMISAQAIGCTLSGSSQPSALTSRPPTAVTANASISFRPYSRASLGLMSMPSGSYGPLRSRPRNAESRPHSRRR